LPNATYGITLGTIKTLIYQLTAMELQGKCWWHNVLQEKYRELSSDRFWTLTIQGSKPAPFNQVPVASTYYLELIFKESIILV
jgi:hypothetical protein